MQWQRNQHHSSAAAAVAAAAREHQQTVVAAKKGRRINFAYILCVCCMQTALYKYIYLKLSKVKLNKMMTIYAWLKYKCRNGNQMAWNSTQFMQASCLHLFAEKLYVYALCMRALYVDLMILLYACIRKFNSISFVWWIVDEHNMWHTYTSRAGSHSRTKPTPQYTYKGTKNENDQFVNQVSKQQRQQIVTLGHPVSTDIWPNEKLINNKCLNYFFPSRIRY